MYLRNDPKSSNDHISYSHEPGTRYQQSLVDLFPRVVDLLTCFSHAFGLEHENPHKMLQRFSRTLTKKNTASSVQSPIPSPLPLSVGAASSTRNSNCPIFDGMELPPAAGGDEVVSTHTIPEEEHARIIPPGPLELFFFCFVS